MGSDAKLRTCSTVLARVGRTLGSKNLANIFVVPFEAAFITKADILGYSKNRKKKKNTELCFFRIFNQYKRRNIY